MNQKINIVFLSISIVEGMAGTKRLQNFALNLNSYENVTYSNIYVSKKKLNKSNSFLDNRNYMPVIFNYKNPITWFSYFFKMIFGIIYYYKPLHKNIIYNYGYPNMINIYYLLFARLIGYKIVYDIVEDNNSVLLFKNLFSRIKIKTSLFLFKRINMLGDGVIGISSDIMNKLRVVIKDEKKLIQLPISVNFDRFNGEVKSSSTEIKIFYGGSYGEKDGLNNLLRAFDIIANDYKNVRLVLTGSATKRHLTKFKNSLSKLTHIDRIIFLGYLDDDNYYKELRSADILCMTRVDSNYANSGFPFKLGEMLATGKPVIATKVGDVTKYLSNNSAVLIKPDSIEAIVIALKKLVADEKLRNNIGLCGYNVAKKYFDSKILTKNILDYFDRI